MLLKALIVMRFLAAGWLQLDGNTEPASAARSGLYIYGTPHLLCEKLTNSKPESGPSIVSRGGRAFLRKALEQKGDGLGLDTRAGIRNTDPGNNPVVIDRLTPRLDHDLSRIGKLYGIGEQISQNLAKSPRVAHHRTPRRGIDPKMQGKSFAGSCLTVHFDP
jgi:hypothetical protein